MHCSSSSACWITGRPMGAWAWLTSPQASRAKRIGETHLERQKEKETDVGFNKGLFHIWFNPRAENLIQPLCIATLSAQHSPQEMKSCKYKSLPKGSRGVRCEEERVWQIFREKCAEFVLGNSRVLVCTETSLLTPLTPPRSVRRGMHYHPKGSVCLPSNIWH